MRLWCRFGARFRSGSLSQALSGCLCACVCSLYVKSAFAGPTPSVVRLRCHRDIGIISNLSFFYSKRCIVHGGNALYMDASFVAQRLMPITCVWFFIQMDEKASVIPWDPFLIGNLLFVVRLVYDFDLVNLLCDHSVLIVALDIMCFHQLPNLFRYLDGKTYHRPQTYSLVLSTLVRCRSLDQHGTQMNRD